MFKVIRHPGIFLDRSETGLTDRNFSLYTLTKSAFFGCGIQWLFHFQKQKRLWTPAFAGVTALMAVQSGFCTDSDSHQKLQRLVAVTHVHTLLSPSGKVSMEAVAALAQQKHIDVLIPTDRFNERWEYGVPPFSGLLRGSMARRSVMSFGPQAYEDLIQKIQKDRPELLMVPGLEVAPAYYWSGHYFQGNLTLQEPQRHILVLGLSNPKDMEELPVLSNPKTGTMNWKRLLGPVLVILSGLVLMTRWPAGLFLSVAGLLWAVNQRPFKRLPEAFYTFSRQGYDAAQILIDNVNQKGGLTVWAHPEAPNFSQPQKLYRSVSTQTRPYPEAILETKNYTGFAYFFEGDKTLGSVGGLWDQALKQYAQGQRERPVWAFGELDWTEEGRLGLHMDDSQNVLWVQEKTTANVLESFRLGRFYAYLKGSSQQTFLNHYGIKASQESILSGGQIVWKPGSTLFFSLTGTASIQEFKADIIRNGVLWKSINGALPFSISLPLEEPLNQMDIYRMVVLGQGTLVTNPVFLKKPTKHIHPLLENDIGPGEKLKKKGP